MADDKNRNGDDLVVLFEGNAFEVMELLEVLKAHNIDCTTNQDISGGLDVNYKAQIIVKSSDEDKAGSLIDPIIDEWDANEKEDEHGDYDTEPVNKSKENVELYNIELWKFVLLYMINPYIFLFYWIFRQWKYLKTKTKDAGRFSPVLIALAQNMAFFWLYHIVYKMQNKNDDLHRFKAIIYPLSGMTIGIALFRLSFTVVSFEYPILYSIIFLAAAVPLLPLVKEINGMDESVERRGFITKAELFILLSGIVIDALVYILLFLK